jgi:enoyl-CoA hydratase
MSLDNLIVTPYPATGVGVIQLHRPEAMNALNTAMMEALTHTLSQWANNSDVRCVLITGGEGKAFAAGADIKQLATLTPPPQPDPLRFWDAVGEFAKPIVCAVNGWALGGGFELALATDIILAAETATFGLPELSLGVIPGAGGCQRLTHCVGHYRAMEMILTGRRIPATEALALGIVQQVVPLTDLAKTAMALAERIAAQPMLAVKAAKQAIRIARHRPLAEGLADERHVFYSLFGSHDQREGMSAFLEKRTPDFKHY